MLSAPDKMRGTVSAPQVASAVARAAERLGWTADSAPLSDGGEGFIDAFGGPNRRTAVSGPITGTVEAGWRLDGRDAYIEMAKASGLQLVGGESRNDAMRATTRGTGEVLAAALGSGARRVVVGLGGSASTDGGLGCFEVLQGDPRLSGVELVAACDVMVPFAAALEFAAQKGASEAETKLLERRLERVAQIYEADAGVDVRALAGSGAAGGLGGALAALGARLTAGIEVVAEAVGLEDRLSAADLVVTGEGLLDAHSFQGKVVGWIADRAAAARVPVLIVVGDRDPEMAPEPIRGEARVVSLVEQFGPEEARSNTLGCIETVIDEHLRG